MGLDDATFDAAFDQAYEQIESQVADTADIKESAPSEEVASSEKLATDKQAKERNDIIEKEYVEKTLKPKKERDETGKFKAKAPVESKETDLDQVADAEVEPEAQEITPATSTITPPARWSAEGKALFSKAPPELQQFISARELETQQIISRVANEAERGKQFLSRLNSDFEDPKELQLHKARLQADGVRDEVEELHRYRAWDRIVRSDVKAACLGLLRNNNLTPQDLLYVDDGQSQYQDPRVDELQQGYQQTQTVLAELQAERVRLQQEQADMELKRFGSGKDSYGNVRQPYLNMYRAQIAAEMPRIMQETGASEIEALEKAYDEVISNARAIHGTPAPVQKPAPLVDATKARLVASGSNGAPKSGVANPKPTLKGKNFNEMFDDAYGQATSIVNAR